MSDRPTSRGASDRVRRSHAQTRATVRLALVFVVAAVVAAVLGDDRWLPLHLFLAGAIVLAISGVSLMLTVTWSAAPAPPDRVVGAQRLCVAVGTGAVAVGRVLELADAVIAVAGAVYIVGLALLAGLLVATVRRGVERRFDVAVAAYVAALTAGLAGVVLGVVMAVTDASGGERGAHATINLLGLIGLVVGGTMPFFAATVGRTRVAPRTTPRRLAALLAWQVSTLVLAVLGLVFERDLVAAVGLAGYAVGVGAVLMRLPRPTQRQLRWAGPRVLALWAGGIWWIVAVAATAIDVADGRAAFNERWLVVLVVAGYAQILWGSLAYLLPMLRGGGHERLGEGFATTRSWLGLAAANVAGVSAACSLPVAITVIAVAIWVLDSAVRAAKVGTTAAPRPTEG